MKFLGQSKGLMKRALPLLAEFTLKDLFDGKVDLS